MSDVNAVDLTEINGCEDVFDLYQGVGEDSKVGVEIELAFFDRDQKTMTVPQNNMLKDMARDTLAGDWMRNEPTSETLEVNSAAAALGDMRSVMDDMQKKSDVIHDAAVRSGLKRSYFQDLPEQSADDLLSSIVDVPRYHAFFKPYREDMRGFAEYFSVCKSNQVSVSHSHADQLLSDVRRLYFMAPFLFLLTDNSTGFSQGKPFGGHSGMQLRHNGLREGRGGVPPYVYSARSGEEFIARHIEHVMNNPLFVYYCSDGNIVKLPAGEWTTFNTLKDKGLNTATNYYFAETVLWPDVKVAALRNKEDKVFAHRYEARMFGVGLHQHQTALLITGALAADALLARKVDDILFSFGFDPDTPEETRVLLEASYEAARTHGGEFFNIKFGNSTMAEFAKAFADAIEPSLDAMGFEDEMLPMLDICRSGCTDGKINRAVFSSLEDILEYQKSYDMDVFKNPNMNAKMLFGPELRRLGRGSATANACCG